MSPGPTPQPGLPADAPRALVIEAVDSPVYTELAKRVQMVPYDGSQKAEDHDLVILDGDAHSPVEVRDHPLVAEAITADTSVLMVDATGDHKREGLGEYLGFASKEDSPAYLARLSYDENHRAEVRVVEFPSNVTSTFTELPATTPVSVTAPGAVEAFVDRALAAVGRPTLAAQQYSPYPCGGTSSQSLSTAQSSSEVIPAGAIYKHVFYCVPVSGKTGGTYGNKNGSQSPYFDTNYTFTLILDNGNEPQGNFQFVAAQVDVSAVPNRDGNGVQPILNNDYNARGWFQDRITVNLAPADNSLFASVADSPETANNTAQVTTDFSVNFTLSGDPEASGSYSNSKTVNLPDWSVTNGSAANAKAWNFKSTNPIDADKLNSAWSSATGRIYELNDLNTNELQFSAQAAWKTGSVQTGWVDFNTKTVQHLADIGTVCNSDPVDPTCNNEVSQGYYQSQPTLSLNMAAVVPVLIKSLTFSKDPALAGGTLTGTVTLKGAAPVDTVIELKSSIDNATVPSTVIIKQGQASADFEILTNANGLAPGGETTATITAFYAQDFPAQLKIVNQPSVDLSFSDTRVTLTQNPTRTGSVALASPASSDVQVNLSLLDGSGNPSDGSATFPSSVTIPQGKSSAPVTITFLAGGSPDNPLSYSLNADAGDQGKDAVEFSVSESVNPLAVDLSFSDTRVYLTDNPTRTGTVTISEPAASDVQVNLSLLDADRNPIEGSATFPASVSIPAGQTSADVTITFTNGGPPGNAFGFYLKADGGNWGQDQIEFVVSKFVNAPSVGLRFSDTTVNIAENATRTGSVTISEPNNTGPVVIALSLLDADGNPSPDSAIFPASVTIPQGQTSADVTITFTNGGPPGNAFGFFLKADGGDWGTNQLKFVVSSQ